MRIEASLREKNINVDQMTGADATIMEFISSKISQEKKLLREKYLQQRLRMPSEEWKIKSDRICENIYNSSLFQNAKVILSYLSFKKEADLSLLHQQSKIRWGLPRCQGKNLSWHQWQWGDFLEKGTYNIPEPSIHSPLIDLTVVDLILVPCVMLDRFGYRLGYGGGYYDRMLVNYNHIPTIGIVFDFAYVSELSIESWDQPLNYICTEFTLEKSLYQIL